MSRGDEWERRCRRAGCVCSHTTCRLGWLDDVPDTDTKAIPCPVCAMAIPERPAPRRKARR